MAVEAVVGVREHIQVGLLGKIVGGMPSRKSLGAMQKLKRLRVKGKRMAQ